MVSGVLVNGVEVMWIRSCAGSLLWVVRCAESESEEDGGV